jgi:hypothetical protein
VSGEVRHRRWLPRESRNPQINGHICSQLNELIAASLLAFPSRLIPEGGYQQSLHDLKGPLTSTNHRIGNDVHGFPYEIVMHV